MAVAIEAAFNGPGATMENYKKALTLMGTSPGGKHPDPSCLFHWATESGGGVHVTDVWKTKEAFEAFNAAHIGPEGAKAGMPKPHIKFVEVDSVLTAGS
jgi:hypothetical protein